MVRILILHNDMKNEILMDSFELRIGNNVLLKEPVEIIYRDGILTITIIKDRRIKIEYDIKNEKVLEVRE